MEKWDYRESQRTLTALRQKAHDLYTTVGIDGLKTRLSSLEAETAKDEFWQNKDHSTSVNQEIGRLKRKIEPWDRILRELDEAQELMDMALSDNDTAVLDEICSKIEGFETAFTDMETRELLSEDDDPNNCFVTIHPGAGGTESQDWANMLFRMYYRWSEKKGYRIDVIDYTPGEEAGIKSATLNIQGDYAHGFLKGERGIHRLVRISPFDANKRRHTSFASVEIIPEVSEEIEVDIREADLRIDTYRASGAGGQHVNKTDSAVRITHLPTGIVVQCQNERSQHKNKAFAMKILKARIYDQRRKEQEEKSKEKLGEKKDISWGNQIRSYVFQPYTLVKDHRTGEETGRVDDVFDGDINRFIYAYLRGQSKGS